MGRNKRSFVKLDNVGGPKVDQNTVEQMSSDSGNMDDKLKALLAARDTMMQPIAAPPAGGNADQPPVTHPAPPLNEGISSQAGQTTPRVPNFGTVALPEQPAAHSFPPETQGSQAAREMAARCGSVKTERVNDFAAMTPALPSGPSRRADGYSSDDTSMRHRRPAQTVTFAEDVTHPAQPPEEYYGDAREDFMTPMDDDNYPYGADSEDDDQDEDITLTQRLFQSAGATIAVVLIFVVFASGWFSEALSNHLGVTNSFMGLLVRALLSAIVFFGVTNFGPLAN